ncbi:MAG: hypothetical protein AAF604_04980 [Acidobacteriota bacterium]
MTARSDDLLQQVVTGDNRQLKSLAAQGLLPVEPADLIPVQVALSAGEDPQLALEADAALRRLEPEMVSHFLERQASQAEIAFFARSVRHPLIMETILARRDVSRELLVELAGNLEPDFQELLLLRQDVVVEEPAVLDALEGNPQVSSYSRRRIREYREHLLPRPRRDDLEPDHPEYEATDEELEAAIAQVQDELPPEEGEEPADELTGLTESQIRMLPVPARMRLTRGARHSLRAILVRDPNPYVAVAVLKFNAVTEQEIEQISYSRLVVEEVLEHILRSRRWVSKYKIASALVHNPRTPVGAAVRMVPRLSVRDLRSLSRDRNVAEPVRATAGRLYRIKRR